MSDTRVMETSEQQTLEQIETQEWLDSLDYVLQTSGLEQVRHLLQKLEIHAQQAGVKIPFAATTPYINTIPPQDQPPYPGNLEIERRVRSIIRWNAMAMVVRANRVSDAIGGHISTYASAATLLEVGFNHFFRGASDGSSGDQIYFQGHASPGMYSRAFLEGRLSEENLTNFRQELRPGGGLSSYPHPWLMPNFWQFPTVSMGLGPLMSIYQARFNRYLEHRGLKQTSDSHVWAFIGDGETDEPETLGAITLASRERLDNLIWVINCNLQRLDGPVRGNGKIIQELEGIFRGAGWNVIKVIWGSDWDPLLAADENGELIARMGEIVDGQYQKYTVESGPYVREHFFNSPHLRELVEHLTDEEIRSIRRGGHDPLKIYAAFKAAVEHKGQPTVILAKTVKGYGLGEAGEGKNITHQQKKLNEDELREFRTRFHIPISDQEVAEAPFYKPSEDSEDGPAMKYIHERRQALGGYLPERTVTAPPLKTPPESVFEEFYTGSSDRAVSSTMAFVTILRKLMRDKEIGKLIVPIIPDEARTFGMEGLFSSYGIYSSLGQLYEPVDKKGLLYYREAKDGQILEEGINEAGAMASFLAAGTAYSTHGVNIIPFYIYYSMFGPQRVGDLFWLAGDIRCRGFLLGGTAGRTTLHGEGLQHQDGHSHLLVYPVPNLMAYDPAFAYELAVIIREGIRRMYEEGESLFYYLTVMNENYVMPPMPEGEGIKEGILRGLYKFRASQKTDAKLHAQLLGSGTILNEVIKAQGILEEKYGVAADVWSVTSYKELYKDGLEAERWNLLHPGEEPKVPYLTQCLKDAPGVFVANSDNVKALPESVSRWVPGTLHSLGTDGFGRSDGRKALRDFFEVDARYVVLATLSALAREKKIKTDVVKKAIKELEIDPSKPNPVTV
jgi:pyruvate dehydrogenase E1 component